MDILPTNSINIITIAFKVLFVIAGCMIVAVNYLHTKEARKMESKLSIALPGSVHLAMSMQLLLSILFLFVTTIFLLIF